MVATIAIERGGSPVFARAKEILSKGSGPRGLGYLLGPEKRRFDKAHALLLLPFAIAATGICSIPVFCNDGHNPLVRVPFPNEATGEIGRVLKIRTMEPNAWKRDREVFGDRSPQLIKAAGRDHRVTRIGKFLRRFSLDEVPQIFQVLTGEFSVVGPRVFSAQEWQYIFSRAPREHTDMYLDLRRAGVKPGVTGLYAISGRGDSSLEERVIFEGMYGKGATREADKIIFWKTVREVLRSIRAPVGVY